MLQMNVEEAEMREEIKVSSYLHVQILFKEKNG